MTMTDQEYRRTLTDQLREAASAIGNLPIMRAGMTVNVNLRNQEIEIHDSQPDDLEKVAELIEEGADLSTSTDADGIRRWASIRVDGFGVTYYRRS